MLSTSMFAELCRAISGNRRSDSSYDPEAGQSLVRVGLTVVVALYVMVGSTLNLIDERADQVFLIYTPIFMGITCLLFGTIRLWPGVNHPRRIFSLILDFASLTLLMALGDAYMAPVASLLLWVTVGFGMRYGERYLAGATVAALVSLAVIGIVSPVWRGQPFMLATMVLTSLIVPFYANLLLANTREAYRAADAANLAKSRFLARASHDLRQPIHAIGLFTNCLAEAGLPPAERKMVQNIEQSLQTVRRMFRSLLDIATLDSGGIVPHPKPLPLDGLLQDVVAQYDEAARRAGIDLRLVRTSLAVQADPALLSVMVQNLISNAVKYAPGAKVLIGCKRRGNMANLSVIDNGIGIPLEHQQHLFEEFYRVQPAGRDVEGVGLGLAIVQRMAHLMGAHVELTSIQGRGTCVTLTGLQVTSLPVPQREPTLSLPQSLLHGVNVLLIEDDPAVLLSTQILMERWGCVVHAFTRPPDDIPPCDMIVADFDLNGLLTGGDAIATIRAVLGNAVPAIIITAHDHARIREQLPPTDDPVLGKPMQPAELRALMLSLRLQANAPMAANPPAPQPPHASEHQEPARSPKREFAR